MISVYHDYLSSIEEIVEEARHGRMVILVADETRENEGDLFIPAEPDLTVTALLGAIVVGDPGQSMVANKPVADIISERLPNTLMLAALSAAIKDAGEGAQTLIGESAAQAKQDARLLVGEAMAECDRLLRSAGEMSAEAAKIVADAKAESAGCCVADVKAKEEGKKGCGCG